MSKMTSKEKIKYLIEELNPLIGDTLNDHPGMEDIPSFIQPLVKTAIKKVFIESIIELYGKEYTDEDLDIIIEYYNSETGKKGMRIAKKIAKLANAPEFSIKLVKTIKDIISKGSKE